MPRTTALTVRRSANAVIAARAANASDNHAVPMKKCRMWLLLTTPSCGGDVIAHPMPNTADNTASRALRACGHRVAVEMRDAEREERGVQRVVAELPQEIRAPTTDASWCATRRARARSSSVSNVAMVNWGNRRAARHSTGAVSNNSSRTRRYHSGCASQPPSQTEPRGSLSGRIHAGMLRSGRSVSGVRVTRCAPIMISHAAAGEGPIRDQQPAQPIADHIADGPAAGRLREEVPADEDHRRHGRHDPGDRAPTRRRARSPPG